MLSTSTVERFGGIARLYGEKNLIRFTQSHVCIIGMGGVGSWAAEALARSGIGNLTLVDLDDICITNINRQIHAMDGTIGKQKIDAMTARINAINPECEVICNHSFYTEKSAETIFAKGFDFVIDAIDHLYCKAHLISTCKKQDIPIIVCGGTGGLKDPSQIKLSDMVKVHNDALLKKVRTLLRHRHGFPKGDNYKGKKFGIECIFSSESPVYPTCDGEVSSEKDKQQNSRLNCTNGYGSITHMTATMGLYAAERCLNRLTQEKN